MPDELLHRRDGEPAGSAGEDLLDVYAELAGTVLRLAREIRLREYLDEGPVVLSASAAQVMQYVDEHPGTTPGEVAGATGLQRSNTSTTLRQLDELGLLERRIDADDRRSVRLFQTDRARQNLRAARQTWGVALGGVMDVTEDVETITTTLQELVDRLSQQRRQRDVRSRLG